MPENYGTIIKLKEKEAILLTNEKDFVMVQKRPGMFLGQTIAFSKNDLSKPSTGKISRFVTIVSGIAAVFLIVLVTQFAAFIPFFAGNAFAFVDIDINPSLQLMIDQDNKVLQAKSLNTDSKTILENLDLKGLSLREAISAIITESDGNGYIEPCKDNFVLISATLNEASKEYRQNKENQAERLSSLLESVQDLAGNEKANYSITTGIIVTSPETRKQAEKNHVSSGRQALAEKAREAGLEISWEEIKSAPIAVVVNKVLERQTSGNQSGELIIIKPSANVPSEAKPTSPADSNTTYSPDSSNTDPSPASVEPRPVLPKPEPIVSPELRPTVPELPKPPQPTEHTMPEPSVIAPSLSLKARFIDSSNLVLEASAGNYSNTDLGSDLGSVSFYLLDSLDTGGSKVLLGSNTMNRTGLSSLKLSPKPGTYKAQAVWTNKTYGVVIYSNSVTYEIKEPAPVIPDPPAELVLKVIDLGNNKIQYSVYFRPVNNSTIVSSGYGTVDFYYSNANTTGSAMIYWGSSEVDSNGWASYTGLQEPGDYKAYAVSAKNPWGKKISSNTATYTIETDPTNRTSPSTTPNSAPSETTTKPDSSSGANTLKNN